VLGGRSDGGLILRVHDIDEASEGELAAGFEAADAVELFGPEMLITHQIGREAAGLAQALRFTQVRQRAPQFRFVGFQRALGKLALGDVLDGTRNDETAIHVVHYLSNGTQMLHHSFWRDDSAYHAPGNAPDRILDRSLERLNILGMY